MEHAHARDMAIADTELTGVNASIEVSSGAFGYHEPIPVQYTADGDGLSPPLEWHCVPMSAEAVVVLVEDADSPTSLPVVHSIMWDLPGTDASLPEGALKDKRCAANDGLAATWLPPDPPAGMACIGTCSRCSRSTRCRASKRGRDARSCLRRSRGT